MVRKGTYRFDDLKPIYVISFLAGNTFKTKEFHQIGELKNQHGELMDNQITHIIVELNKWHKTVDELTTDLDKLLYIMKFTDTAKVNEEIPTAFDRAAWIESMIKELDKRNKTPDEVRKIEMALAREMSMLVAEEEKIKKARTEERKKAKKRLNFERKKAEEKLAKEKQLAEKKLAKEKQLAEKKLAKEKQLAEEKLAKEKQLAEEKLAKEKQLAEEKLAKEKQELIEENVRNLLALKIMSDEQIALALGLSLKKIKQLKKSNPDEN